jgi:hypothetical protein
MMDLMDEEPQLSNEILKYYVEWAPHRLSTVIIDSCLGAYSQKMALLLLGVVPGVNTAEAAAVPRRPSPTATPVHQRMQSLPMTLQGQAAASSANEVPPKDLFAKALLHLDVGETAAALIVLKSIGSDRIVEFCCANRTLLAQSEPSEQPAPQSESGEQ